MTPAPISVERLRELIAEYWDLAYAEGAESRSHDTPAGDAMRVSAEIDKCIAALLQQLAEREAECKQHLLRALENGAAYQAAERERNDAMAILLAIDYAGCLGAGMKTSIAAFLAASGGA